MKMILVSSLHMDLLSFSIFTVVVPTARMLKSLVLIHLESPARLKTFVHLLETDPSVPQDGSQFGLEAMKVQI